jgi:UTP--glucose-1-phosphate uridylyltransferase
MRALTGGAPKEMIPVAGRPAIDWVMRECAASGASDVLIVTAPGKEALTEHVLRVAGTPGMPGHCEVVVQHEAHGLADAIRLGRDFSARGPLAVALPDNIFLAKQPALWQVMETHRRTGKNVVAVVEIHAEEAVRRGPTPVLRGEPHGDDFHPERIPDKGDRHATFDAQGADRAFTAVGRYVFTPGAFTAIDQVELALPPGAELDDVPVMQHLLGCGELVGRRIVGRFLDIGLPLGYEEAHTLLAQHPRFP